MYDVIVVGARCAGSPVAMLLARQGHRVLVVDRATFPSDAASTHYIHQVGLAKLRDWGLLDELIATGTPAVTRMEYRYTGIDLIGWPDPVRGISDVHCPRRYVLDEILVNAARRAGAEVVEGFTVTDLVTSGGVVVGVRGRDGAGPERELRARLVIGADGVRSQVAKRVDAEFYNVHPAAGFTFYSYYGGLDWGMHHKTGMDERWFGTWPTNGGTMIAVMATKRHLREFRAAPEESIGSVLDEIEPRLGEELRDSGVRQEPITQMRYPDNFYRRAHGPGWALVGDAAYHKDPMTGWGISDAFLHGEILAGAVHEGLSGARPMADALAGYEKARDESSAPVYGFTTVMAELRLPPFFAAVLRAISTSEYWTTKMLGVSGGGVDGAEIFGPDALRRIYDDAGVPEAERLYSPA